MLAFATSVLSGLSDLLGPFAGANAMALAVVLFTIAVRLAVSPLSVAQARGERRRAALAPRLQEIRQRYGDQPDRLREELTALGGAPLADCLPALRSRPRRSWIYLLPSRANR